ncbi:MAG: hypothetical protein N2747_04835 [Chitinophagaceae bacterium]|nr:hypothetical protein [Chitinophagaceae bacterium]
MSNRQGDILFQLIKSLEKAEKRYFKLYIHRNSEKADLKIVKLFDLLEKQKTYDEEALLKKMGNTTKSRLANLKTHLYKEILASLRLQKSADSLDLQLNEQFDYAHILYKKGLYMQSLRIIEKAKETARENQKYYFLPQLISLEKRIEGQHITRNIHLRAEALSREANDVNYHLDKVTRLSNLSLQLFSWFVQHGHARNDDDETAIKKFLKINLPSGAHKETGFFERMYLYLSYVWYAYIRQDFLQYYRYAFKLTCLFDEQPLMKRVETAHYIRALHYLLNAHFNLRNHRGFDLTIRRLEEFAQTPRVQENDNFRIQSFIYLSQAKINRHFMQGTFSEGLQIIPSIEKNLSEYELFLDRHRILVLNYKFAMMHFGCGQFGETINYLQKILYDDSSLREDLQCYARLLHLMAHYELGNDMLMESLTKSVYRFMVKMKSLTAVEEAILKFLRRAFLLSPRSLRPELENLHATVKALENNKYQRRSFAYLDILSWIESKLSGKTMQQVVYEKYLNSKHR